MPHRTRTGKRHLNTCFPGLLLDHQIPTLISWTQCQTREKGKDKMMEVTCGHQGCACMCTLCRIRKLRCSDSSRDPLRGEWKQQHSFPQAVPRGMPNDVTRGRWDVQMTNHGVSTGLYHTTAGYTAPPGRHRIWSAKLEPDPGGSLQNELHSGVPTTPTTVYSERNATSHQTYCHTQGILTLLSWFSQRNVQYTPPWTLWKVYATSFQI